MGVNEDIPNVLTRLSREKSRTMLGSFSTKYDPWRILIGTILSARARDEVTEPLCEELFKRYPDAKSLANAKPKEVEQQIRRIGFYRNKAKHIINASKIIIERYNGKVPETMEELLHLPGVGRKVAGCVLVYAHNKDAIPVDTHVHRLSNRLGWVKTKTPEQTEQKLMQIVPKKYWQVVNDYLVWHGKTTCKPITPECSRCVVRQWCKRVGVTKWK